jgi:hypothetical protein
LGGYGGGYVESDMVEILLKRVDVVVDELEVLKGLQMVHLNLVSSY